MLYLCSSLSSLVPFTSKTERLMSYRIYFTSWGSHPEVCKLLLPPQHGPTKGHPRVWLDTSIFRQSVVDLICCSLFPFLLLPKVYHSEENIISIYQCNQTKRFCCELGEDRVSDGNSKFNYWQWNEYKMFLHAQFWTMHCFQPHATWFLRRYAEKS